MGSLFNRRKDVKTHEVSHNKVPAQQVNLNAIGRQIRILNERLAVLETSVSTLRRDFNRVDRREYRKEAASHFEETKTPLADNGIWSGLQRGC